MSFITNAEGNFFIQERRAVKAAWLTCTGVGDVTLPEGDLTPQYCPDPLNSGDFKIDGFIRGDKGAATYSLEKPLSPVYNFLIESPCPFAGRINWVCRGIRQDPRNYELAVLMPNSEPTGRAIRNPARAPGASEERVMTNLDLSFPDALMLYHLTIVRQAVDNTSDANAVFFLPQRCEDRCGDARGLCEEGLMGLDGSGYLGLYPYAYDSEIKKTHNYGATWTPTAAEPYTYGGNTAAVLAVETAGGGVRIIVFRASQVPGAPAECAYSDDWGANYTDIAIGAINNQAVRDWALCGAKIVVCCTDGYIYESTDQAESWQIQEAAAETLEDLNAIVFYSDNVGFCVGDGNTFLYTLNSGVDWATGTPPVLAVGANLLSVACNDKGHAFTGTNDARLFRTEDDDGADGWTLVVDLGGGTIPWLAFDPKAQYVGAMVRNTTAPLGELYRSEDGGASWVLVPGMPANAGLNSGFMCDHNYIVVVGNTYGAPATTFVAKTQPIS